MLTKKGLKMSISKCLRNYKVDKSESVTTEVRGVRDQTEGYIFIDDLENNRIILTWHDDNISFDEKFKKVKKLFDTLNIHGFLDYMELNKNKAEIYLTNFE